jgi:hypothetical protein
MITCLRLAALVACVCFGASFAAAEPGRGRTLAKCRAAARDAGADPTRFPCNWRIAVRSAAGAALTGKFSLRQKGAVGTLTILEGGSGPALIGLQTTARNSGNTCTVKTTAQRGADDALTSKPAEATGCTIRIVSSGLDKIRVVSEACQSFCGLNAGFDGIYKLDRY